MQAVQNRGTQRVHPSHVVQFYEDERFLAGSVAGFLAPALLAGAPAVIIAIEGHIPLFVDALRARSVDVDCARTRGQLTCVDARDLLTSFMTADGLDRAKARRRIRAMVRRIQRAFPNGQLRAYGEMVELLWRGKNAEAAVQLEEEWNHAARSLQFSLMCAYDVSTVAREGASGDVRDICAAHADTYPAETYSDGWTPPDRQHAIVNLQLRAAALSTEVAQRKALERALRRTLAARRLADRERAHAEARAAGAQADLARAQQATNEWLVQAVHNMRTPLNAILGWTQIANLKPNDTSTLKHALDVIERNAVTLNRLVDDLLERRRTVTPCET